MTLRRRHVYESPDLTGRKPATVVMSNGLGVDSMALLHQWCTDPSTRDFPLDELLIVTAVVGNEYEANIAAANIGNLGYQCMRSYRRCRADSFATGISVKPCLCYPHLGRRLGGAAGRAALSPGLETLDWDLRSVSRPIGWSSRCQCHVERYGLDVVSIAPDALAAHQLVARRLVNRVDPAARSQQGIGSADGGASMAFPPG